MTGSVLLSLPVSSAGGKAVPYIDALFTATSSICVTGLVTVPTVSTWSIFGQAVILVLIQIGGLGVITIISGLMIGLHRKIGIGNRMLIQDAFNLNTLSGLVKFIKKVFVGTFVVESIGTLLYMTVFIPEYGVKGIWISVFNSISAFCNAGMDVISEDSLCGYTLNPMMLAVDIDEDIVNEASDEIPYCKCADVTDAEVIRRLGIADIDVVIIAMADNLEACVMATMLCKEVGVKTVIAKCSNEMNCKILSKVGADRVVFPESESGIRMAKNLLSSGFVDIVELSKDVSLIELDVKPEWEGKNLIELNLRKKYAMNIVAIIEDKSVCINIDPNEPLNKSMKLIVIANPSKANRLK